MAIPRCVTKRPHTSERGTPARLREKSYLLRRRSVTKVHPSLLDFSPVEEPAILVVEDDPSIREALRRLFASVGLAVQTFGSASELLESTFPDAPSCLVLDIRLPGRSGLDLQAELAKAGINVPIV